MSLGAVYGTATRTVATGGENAVYGGWFTRSLETTCNPRTVLITAGYTPSHQEKKWFRWS